MDGRAEPVHLGTQPFWEGSSELIYLQVASSILEGQGKVGLRSDITIVPTGGLDKVVTFIALLGANKLKIAVFHDYHGTPDQRLLDVMREKMIASKAVLDASQFRDLSKLGVSGTPSDTEDLFEVSAYLKLFNAAEPEATRQEHYQGSRLATG